MGVVYLGKDPYINRKVSIKISRPSADVKGEKADKYRERFFLEAQSAGRLMHPNIVAIYDGRDVQGFLLHHHGAHSTVRPWRNPANKDSLLPVSRVVELVFEACNASITAHKRE